MGSSSSKQQANRKASVARLQKNRGNEHEHTIRFPDYPLSLIKQGKASEATAWCEEQLEKSKSRRGLKNPDTMSAMFDLARSLHYEGKLGQAKDLYQSLVLLTEECYEPYHPTTIRAVHALAAKLFALGQGEQAKITFEKELMLREKTVGREHPDALSAMMNIAVSVELQRHFRDAEQMFRKLLPLRVKVCGPNDSPTISTLYSLYRNLIQLYRYDEAKKLIGDELLRCDRALGQEHELTIRAMDCMHQIYVKKGQVEDACSMLRSALSLSKKVFGPDDKVTKGQQQDLDRLERSLHPQGIDNIGLLQAIAAKEGLPIPADPFAESLSINSLQILGGSTEVSGTTTAGPEVAALTVLKFREKTKHHVAPPVVSSSYKKGDVISLSSVVNTSRGGGASAYGWPLLTGSYNTGQIQGKILI